MSSINKKNKMNKNSDNKIKLTFHPAEFGAKMPIPLAEQSVKAGFPSLSTRLYGGRDRPQRYSGSPS